MLCIAVDSQHFVQAGWCRAAGTVRLLCITSSEHAIPPSLLPSIVLTTAQAQTEATEDGGAYGEVHLEADSQPLA